MNRFLRVFAVVVVVVGGAGYGATEYINSTTGTATPPSPYASQSPPDCFPPEKNPVSCGGAYQMTCEEMADYYRRLEAVRPGTAHQVLCDGAREAVSTKRD